MGDTGRKEGEGNNERLRWAEADSQGKRHKQREIRMEKRQGKTKIETKRETDRVGAAWNRSLSYSQHCTHTGHS